jgi:uncharacterized protein (DUF433 family)
VKDLWEIIHLYEEYEKKLGSEHQNRNISKYEQVTLLYVTTYLRNHPGVTGKIVIDGVDIPVIYVLLQLKIRGKDIRTVTTEQLRAIVRGYVSRATSIPLIPIPLGKQPTKGQITELKTIIAFLKTQGPNAMGSFIFSGYRISIRFILRYLAQHRRNVKNLTSEELWRIVRVYITEIEKLNKLPGNVKTDLRNILKYLKFLGHGATGEITFNGHRISVDFILTVVLLQGGDINSLTVEDVWEIIQLYEVYGKKLGSEPQNRSITKSEQVTLLYVIMYLRSHQDVSGEIVIDGVKITVSYILNQLKTRGIDIRTVNIEQIHKIISAYISKYNPPKPVPLGKQPTEEEKLELNTIIDFLKTQGTKATGSFIVSGYRISVQFILRYLAQHGRNVRNLKAEELWIIIRAYITENEKLNKLPGNVKTDLRTILKYLKFLGHGATGEITFNGQRISVDFILTVIHLEGGDINSLTAADLWEIIQLYEVYGKKLESESQNRNISKYEQVSLLYAITYLRSHQEVTGEIVIDGVKISVSYILNQLKIRGEDIRTVNIEQIHKIITAYISKYNPPKPVPLGKQPTKGQITELKTIIDFLKTQGTNATGSFTFSGYRISVQFILKYLAQNGRNVGNLTAEVLWRIIMLYASNETNTTTEASGTGPAGPHLNDTLHKILEELLTEGINATGYIQFRGENISLQFIQTALSLKHIDVRNATAADIHHILLLYVRYADATNPNEGGVPKDKIVTLLLILQYLKTNTESDNGKFNFDGYEISRHFIEEIIKEQNVSVNNLTITELYLILNIYIGYEGSSTLVNHKPPGEAIASLEQVLKILKEQRDNAKGAVEISGYIIAFEYINFILKARGIDAQNASRDQLWLIIELSIEFQKQSGKAERGPQAILKFFIEILSKAESVNNSVLVVDGHSVSISEVVSALGLKIDNSTGKYDTANLTSSIVFRAVLEVIGKQRSSTGSSQTAHGKDELLKDFLQVISNPDYVANSVIVYNGQHISVPALVSALGLHIDGASGKYDTHSLTADQLYEAIQQFISTTQNATT